MTAQTLTDAQQDVLTIIARHGPLADDETASLVHHRMSRRQASSGVRTRRSELVAAGLVRPVGRIKMASGRHAGTFGVTARGRRLA